MSIKRQAKKAEKKKEQIFLLTRVRRLNRARRTCCVTGEPVTSGFCRFPDYVSGTLMVMSKKAMIEHLRTSTTIQVFKEILAKTRRGDLRRGLLL